MSKYKPFRVSEYENRKQFWIKKNGCLVSTQGGYSYEIDLDRVRTAEQALDWMCQLSGKTWSTGESLHDLATALAHHLEKHHGLRIYGT